MAAAASSVAVTPAQPRVVSRINPANAVTASRFLTLPPFVWAVSHGYHQWATLFILICGLLDKLDGLVARIFNCRSAFGELFDAITDGICYGFALVIVTAYGWAPAIPVAIVVFLGVANSAMRAVYLKRAGRPVNYKSHAMERIVAYTAYLIGFATGDFDVNFLFWAFPPIFAITVIHDAKRMLVDPIPHPEGAPA
jgi:phosphatidylglycerophosphate synthase